MIKKFMEHYLMKCYDDSNARVLSINLDDDSLEPVEYGDGLLMQCVQTTVVCNGITGPYTFEWDCEDMEICGSMAGDGEDGKQLDFYGDKIQEWNVPCISFSQKFTKKDIEDCPLVVPVHAVGIEYPFENYQRAYFDKPATTLHGLIKQSQKALKSLIENASEEDSKNFIHGINDYVIEHIRTIGNGLAKIELGS